MLSFFRSLPLPVFILSSAFVGVSAQQTAQTATPATPLVKTNAREAANAKKAKTEQQKALALSLLVSLANDARNYSDSRLRARTLSRIADAFWDADPEQGRALFRKAWDAAEVADQDSARKLEEERQQQQAGNPRAPFALVQPPDLRAEVLRFAARRDRTLGEELLDKLKEARKQEATDTSIPAPGNPLDTPAAVRQRLRLANQLLETDVERALQFADPALTSVTLEALNFLSFLRDKNAAAADQRYARLLAMADADVKSDANTISLLSSYLFTPHVFVTFEAQGGQSTSQMNQRTGPPDVSPELRNAFFRAAADVLLRPSPAREQDHSSSGLVGKYLVIRRLLPVFEQFAAKEVTSQLRAEMSVLAPGVDQDIREADDESPMLPKQSPERRAEDLEKSLLDRLDRARTSEERDGLYLQLASRAAQKGDLRARDFVEKIEDSELRKQAQQYIDMNLALNAVDKKETEKELLLVDKAELNHLQKTWLLSEAIKNLLTTDKDKALLLVSDALAEARRIDVSDPDRPRALIALANALLTLDRARAWELMLEVAKAANSAEGFNGEDGRLTIRLQSKTMTSMRSATVDEFDLPGIFRALSQENPTQAIEIARSFENEAPRATAMIAIARALLADKSK